MCVTLKFDLNFNKGYFNKLMKFKSTNVPYIELECSITL